MASVARSWHRQTSSVERLHDGDGARMHCEGVPRKHVDIIKVGMNKFTEGT